MNPITAFEEKALYALAKAKKAYDDANPDVGFKPTYQFVEDAARELRLTITHDKAQQISRRLTSE